MQNCNFILLQNAFFFVVSISHGTFKSIFDLLIHSFFFVMEVINSFLLVKAKFYEEIRV